MRIKAVFGIILAGVVLIPLRAAADNATVLQEKQILHGHIPPDVASAKQLEKLDGKKRLKLVIGLPLHDKQALKEFLAGVSNPKSPNYRHYLTSQEFIDKYCETREEYVRVKEFLKSKNLNITNTFPDRMLIDAEGAASDIEKAFNVNFYNYRRTDSTVFYAPDTEPSIDSGIAILHISGLSNAGILKPMALTGSGLNGSFMGQDFRNAYAQGVPSSLIGTGQIVGIFAMDNYYTSDITAYEQLASLPNVQITNKIVYGSPATFYNYNSELSMDISAVISMAQGCQVYVYEAYYDGTQGGYDNILEAMAGDTQVNQFTSSFSVAPPLDITALNSYLKIEAQGQSFFHASGDSGAYAPGSMAGFDIELPDITIVGGTDLTTVTGGGAWVSETVWNDWCGASGGGICPDITIPYYQQGIINSANAPYVSTSYRNIPDVAAVAQDVFIVYDSGVEAMDCGTSFASPLWAGFCALINQEAAIRGNSPVGFLNPAIYAIGEGPNYTTDFHDITTGNNGSSTQYPAVTGYDLCTGWGSPNGMPLISDLAGPTQSDTPTITQTYTATPVVSSTDTLTDTPTLTQTDTPTITLTATMTLTQTDTLTQTQTYTPTPVLSDTDTPTITFTPTQTNTFTCTPTFTVSPQYSPTSTQIVTGNTELVISNVFVYPNPLETGDDKLYIRLDATHQPQSISMKIYTASFRLIKEKTWSADSMASITWHYTVNIPAGELNNLGNGTYYYVLTAEDSAGMQVKSSTGVLIVLK